MSGVHLAFLLHMHQPLYVDPGTGRALLPWVRLHGARAYLDVARLLDEFSDVRLTVNFVPSLLEQLEAVCAESKTGIPENADAWLEVALRPTGAWTPAERQFLVERYFSVAWNPNVESRPRYRELLEKRGRQLSPADLPARAAAFTDGELRDLTVLFHLAWLGFAAREGEPAVAELERKGRDFREEDLHTVLAVGRKACARVLPLYRKLAARGQVELSSSPYYHPIVPLVCDSEAARRSQPALPLPDHYAAPDDARAQIALGRDAWRRCFAPEKSAATSAGPSAGASLGMWPPEGSISPEAVAAYRAEGIRWLASDEGNLWRSLDLSDASSSGGAPSRTGRARGELYRPWRYDGVDLVFRDREISDRIGFHYAQADPRAAVDDLLGRVRAAGELGRAAIGPGGAPALVSVILDGENPWEAYPGSGEPFLRTLFSELTRRAQRGAEAIRPVAIAHHLDEHPARATLTRLSSGSWIDADFHIWIGDPVKNRAWNLLGRLRRRWLRAREHDPTRAAAARRHLLAAEGSDWFWWFGEPFHSAEDALFDRLFRAHLAAGWRALGETPPVDLDRPVAGGERTPTFRRPRAFLAPVIDGRVGSYFEWIDAGRYDVGRGAAMAESPLVSSVYFGFDATTLFLRCDPGPGARAALASSAIDLTITTSSGSSGAATGNSIAAATGNSPGGSRDIRLTARPGDARFLLHDPTRAHSAVALAGLADPVDLATAHHTGQLACREIVEMAIPFADLGLRPGERIELVLRLLDDSADAEAGEVVRGRYPREGSLEVVVPDEGFEADHWL